MNYQQNLNLDQPIFVVYFNVDGMGRQRAQEQLGDFVKTLSDNSNNMTFWIIPVKNQQETKIEVVWRGNENEKQYALSQSNKQIIQKFNRLMYLFSENADNGLIQQEVRRMRLNEITN